MKPISVSHRLLFVSIGAGSGTTNIWVLIGEARRGGGGRGVGAAMIISRTQHGGLGGVPSDPSAGGSTWLGWCILGGHEPQS